MDEPPKKRRFWQFHLSTAVLLMFVVGGYMLANFRVGYDSTLKPSQWAVNKSLLPDFLIASRPIVYGWPAYTIIEMHEDYQIRYAVKYPLHPDDIEDQRLVGFGNRKMSYVWKGIAINLAVLIFLVTASALLCEYLIRRREGRKP